MRDGETQRCWLISRSVSVALALLRRTLILWRALGFSLKNTVKRAKAGCRMLRRIIKTLATGGGEYSEAEVYLVSDEMLAVVVALIEARERGFYSEQEWRAAG